MEVEEVQTQGSKFPRISTFGENEPKRSTTMEINTELGRFCGWPASRIVRVSRASGGKDRHSKVWTSKGLRDRRVRLSVHTAIQFYDLQDRLGYDQPSKAVEWLLKAAAGSIDELPSINTSFPQTSNQGSEEPEMDTDPAESTHPHSSNSETSKGSGGPLSLSRTENRVKARERAKERRAERDKERVVTPNKNTNTNNNNHLLAQSSFTELLTSEGASLFDKQRQWGSTHAPPMDYFPMAQYHSQIQSQNQSQNLNQHFSLLADHMMPSGADLNFTMSSSSSSGNMNRGTLQSNSPHSLLLPHHHPYGSGIPFLIGTAATENHHHHNNNQTPFHAGFQLCYGDDNGRHLDHKGKGKN